MRESFGAARRNPGARNLTHFQSHAKETVAALLGLSPAARWVMLGSVSARLKAFVLRWLVNTLAVVAAAQVVSGIRYDHALDLFAASLTLGLLNAFLRPVLMLLSFPLLVLTLGLFTLVINAALLYLVGSLLPGFHVAHFPAAFWGALIISLVSLVLHRLVRPNPNPDPTPSRRSRMRRPAATRRGPPRGEGPVIDV